MARKRSHTRTKAIEPASPIAKEKHKSLFNRPFRFLFLASASIVVLGVLLLFLPMLLSTQEKGAPSSSRTPSQSNDTIATAEKLDLPDQPVAFEFDQLRDEMIAQARRLEQSHSKSPDALDLAASVFYDLNQPEEADRLWKACCELNPKQPDLYTNYARFLNQLDRSEAAIELLNKAHTSLIESSSSYFELAKAYDLVGDLEKSVSVGEEIVRRFPDYGECYLLIGKLKNKLGLFEEARKNLLKAIELQQPEVDVWPVLVPVLVRLGDRESAKALQQKLKSELTAGNSIDATSEPFHLTTSASLRNRAVRLFRLASLIERKANNDELANTLLTRSLSLDPNNPSSLLKLAEQFVQKKDVGRAIAVFQRLVDVEPGNVVNFSNLAALAFQTGNQQLAVHTLESGLNHHADATNLQIPLGKIYMSQGKPLQAREVANKALEKQENLDALMILAASYQHTGEHQNAARIMERAKHISATASRK